MRRLLLLPNCLHNITTTNTATTTTNSNNTTNTTTTTNTNKTNTTANDTITTNTNTNTNLECYFSAGSPTSPLAQTHSPYTYSDTNTPCTALHSGSTVLCSSFHASRACCKAVALTEFCHLASTCDAPDTIHTQPIAASSVRQ